MTATDLDHEGPLPRGPAELYARLHRGNPGDLDFYRRACVDASTVLELGCGHGRVLRAIATPQMHLVGVDLDPELLALARRGCARIRPQPASLELIEADFAGLDLGRAFDRVLLPYCGLYCLADEAAIVAALSCARAHLAPAGELLFDAYHVEPIHDELVDEPAPVVDEPAKVAELRWRGRDYEVHEACRWWPSERRVEVVYEHRAADGGPPIVAGIRHRYVLARELPRLAAAAGLRILELHGGFMGEPLSDESEMVVARAARA
ncbi:MAG: class I SAM-dependent methyltransferase [Nannocystaceae bacterium]